MDKSWKEVNRILKLMRLTAKGIQDHTTQMTIEMDKLVAYSKELYQVIPKHDGTLYALTPISQNALLEYLMNHIFKYEDQKELQFSRRIKRTGTFNPVKPKDFAPSVEEALGWANRFEKAELEKIT